MPVELPQDLWSRILGFCLEPRPDATEEDVKEYQPQTFYLAAAPHLYRRPLVAHPGSFFLGLDRAFPSSPPTPSGQSDLDYLSSGNTKLPLPRHVQHLTLLSRSSFTNAHAYDSISFTAQSVALAERVLGRVHFPGDALVSGYTGKSPLRGVLPLLREVSFGCDVSHHSDTLAPVQMRATPSFERLASLLLRVGELPKVLCVSGMFSPVYPQCEDWPHTRAKSVTHHADLLGLPRIVYGTLNRVYVDGGVGPEMPSQFDEPGERMMISDVDKAASIIVAIVESNKPAWTNESVPFGDTDKEETKRQKEVIGAARLEVYGLEAILDVPPVPSKKAPAGRGRGRGAGGASGARGGRGGGRGGRGGAAASAPSDSGPLSLKERTIEAQVKALAKISTLVKNQLGYDWIKLLPGSATPKCEACGLKPQAEAGNSSGGGGRGGGRGRGGRGERGGGRGGGGLYDGYDTDDLTMFSDGAFF
ncbi:hypothetical protein IAT38_007510 [Cryptococcus sp. DSM 104549]